MLVTCPVRSACRGNCRFSLEYTGTSIIISQSFIGQNDIFSISEKKVAPAAMEASELFVLL